jgi:hypothetical protein
MATAATAASDNRIAPTSTPRRAFDAAEACADTQEQKDQSLAKRQATNIQRYGIANPLQNVEKIKQSNLKNLGVTNPNKLTRVRNKIRSTCERKYGGPAPACDSSIQDKITQTNLSRYGTASTFENPLIRAKQLSTLVQNYGVEYPIQNPEIAHKIKQTNLSRYGYENASQNPEVIQKIKASQPRLSFVWFR